ncbi:MAG: DUF393 domain-containing protein [Acidobacteriota bacterium]
MTPSTSPGSRPERIFYDGDCGVCHWAVDFVARRDEGGRRFRFAPLGGAAFEAEISPQRRSSLPDSMLVLTGDGQLLLRSDGALHILRRIGGPWGFLAALLRVVPRPLRDWGYDLFARVRHRLVRPPEGTCPLMPPELRARFDA